MFPPMELLSHPMSIVARLINRVQAVYSKRHPRRLPRQFRSAGLVVRVGTGARRRQRDISVGGEEIACGLS
jgi:hypothetical protein